MKKILSILLFPMLAGSCGLYSSYHRPEIDTEGLLRDTITDASFLPADTVSLGDVPWQDIFTDPRLQTLIEAALRGNTDLQTAQLKVEEAEAALLASRLSFLPSLALAPEGAVSRFDGGKATKTYTIPVAASWEIDIFGKLRNAKERAKAAYEQSEVYLKAVQTQLVASVANLYYTLLMLDRQCEISTRTAAYWKENVETMQAMKRAGMATEDAVAQSEANYYAIEASVLTLGRQIKETENSLSVLLGETPRAIERGRLEDWRQPAGLTLGVPLRLLAARPDVRSAELSLAQAFYTTQGARAAFYPSLTLSGSAGWTNSAGAYIANPGKLLLSAVASLTQPLFAKGANIAQLKIAKAQQEEALLNFRQTVLDAGAEVNNALRQCQTARGRIELDLKQIAALETAVRSTELLMKHGHTTYLEVLVAQVSLLQSQLTWVADQVDEIQGVISLYHALGGGAGLSPETASGETASGREASLAADPAALSHLSATAGSRRFSTYKK